jgi:lysyl-tRNA synthetase, class II
MATLQDYRNERLRKLQDLKDLGINPYPAKCSRTHDLVDMTGRFEALEGQTVSGLGRITSIRKFGKLAFVVIKDASGSIQLFVQDGVLAAPNFANSEIGMSQLNLLDTGDFVEASGKLVRTQTGEISIELATLRLLTKTLRPMPSAQEGFTNKEERLRRRYIDTNVNKSSYDRFIRRSKFWTATREYLNQHGFYEINIPVLEHTTGGADANPFVTHMDALDQDFYLRISHELPLKRLLGGGYEKVYDIGPRFRNENYSDEHLPEHIAMEWYWAYADWRDGMNFMTEMYRYVIEKTFGTLQFKLGKFEIDLSKDWEQWDYAETIKNRYGIDVFDCTLDQVKEALKANKLEVEQTENKARGIDKLWKNIRKDVTGPIWLINTPLFISPLAKTNLDNPNTVQRFQPVMLGSELGNGYSELNDPVDQLNRFVEQESMRGAGDNEAMMMDIDFVEMLEYGMPPACGWGFSERVFWLFEGVSAREGVPFPQMRMEIDEVTKAIYPQVSFKSHENAEPTIEFKDLPISAAEQGTKKLYLDNYAMQSNSATILATSDLSVEQPDGSTSDQVSIIVDQTCIYPGGGGQGCDLGSIVWDGGSLSITEVKKTPEGIVQHNGLLSGSKPEIATAVECHVDSVTRLYNSRMHSAGHLLDYAVYGAGKAWDPGKGSHYEGRCFVEYKGEFDPSEVESLIAKIEATFVELIAIGGAVTPMRVQAAKARELSRYIPEQVIKSYQNIHIAKYPKDFYICCGGTHVADVSQLGEVKITKIKKKDGNIRISYSLQK